MSETTSSVETQKAKSTDPRIGRIFELAYKVTDYLRHPDPLLMNWESRGGMHEQARQRLQAFTGEVALWREERRAPATDRRRGIHAVHPDPFIHGSYYEASRPALLTFELVTIGGRDSRSDYFSAEQLVFHQDPTRQRFDDPFLSRVNVPGRPGLHPMAVGLAHDELDEILAKLTDFSATSDTADTTRVMIRSGHAVPSR